MKSAQPTQQNTENAKRKSSGEIPEYVTKEANLGDVVSLYPIAADVLLEYGLHCVGCFAAGFDTLESGARLHGMTDAEIDEMIHRVNASIHFGKVIPVSLEQTEETLAQEKENKSYGQQYQQPTT